MVNDPFQNRKYVIGGFMLLVVAIYMARMFVLQILDSSYRDQADSNAFYKEITYPPRGVIKDRNGKAIAFNKDAYDILITVRDAKGIDTLSFCSALGIDREAFEERMKKIKQISGYSPYTPQTFMSQLSDEEFAPFQEKMFRFKGISVRKRTLRNYSYPCGALLLGDLGEISSEQLKKKQQDNDNYYQPGDFIGLGGLERTYEKYLRGQKGVKIWLRDAHGRKKGRYEEGAKDVPFVAGSDITTTIDIDLQDYGEQLMANKVGSIVAIEPKTGEILAMVSAPTYDPSLLVGRKRSKEFVKLVKNPYKPLFDRTVQATYPPGSTFKTANTLVLMQEGFVNANKCYSCTHGFHAGRLTVGCHHNGSLDLINAIKLSCNAYFCYGFKDMVDHPRYKGAANGFETWKNHLVSMGFGYRLGTDAPSEKRGYIPNAGVYNKIYGERHWKATTIISDAIGQGEILTTPIQLANLAAVIANRGYYYTPHLIKGISGTTIDSTFTTKHVSTIDPKHFGPVIDGMEQVVQRGTAYWIRNDELGLCGKTGTAQNPHGKDHALFISFAPKDDPKIAICVVVENAGFGATWAAPIAALMTEKYLNGQIETPKRQYWESWLKEANLLPYLAPVIPSTAKTKQ
ncbi:MAG: penicillin-binding protein 2 [Paludibacteraceae bacterium]|nr:penicillin-binding protein 2 [Paludibacteraceae bacterium]